ncbi:ferric reductase [Paucibacter sp. KBW04]|uniref:ferredoxin reductase family protein n=1 Tax=Paucibacter sp. KBW04 TaxID=2153361 RepID=UPI000F579131|nr:ferric reductase-like transmembrane domain-containing protein [Paucibacter sp. KBW04]RQO63065.1 ferric reductase [Paucibacter sp. KBW04]
MKAPTAWVILLLLLAGLLGLPAWPAGGSPDLQRWTLYLDALYLSGYLAIGLMAVAMLLALRLPRLEGWLGGLDQAYRLHRHLAQWGIVLALFHYLLRLGVKQLRAAGWMIKPEGLPSNALEFLRPLHGTAKDLAEWTLYLAAALVLVALWRRVPYRWFARLHRLLPVAFLLMVYHSLVFLPLGYWQGLGLPAAGLILGLMALGTVAALLSLFGRVGQRRRVAGELLEVNRLPLDVLELRIKLAEGWPGHDSGQFGLATFDSREGAHPFTIASSWKGDGELRFAIKALGDYTRVLPTRLAPGDPVWVEGPYGRFVFADSKPHQIWVGAGIGMTPFLARLQELAQRRQDLGSQGCEAAALLEQGVDLFYCTRKGDPDITQRIRDLAGAAGVRLHVLESSTQGQLSAQRLMQEVPQWREASLWFCGPARFGQALREGLSAAGLAAGDFHQEAFEFR